PRRVGGERRAPEPRAGPVHGPPSRLHEGQRALRLRDPVSFTRSRRAVAADACAPTGDASPPAGPPSPPASAWSAGARAGAAARPRASPATSPEPARGSEPG